MSSAARLEQRKKMALEHKISFASYDVYDPFDGNRPAQDDLRPSLEAKGLRIMTRGMTVRLATIEIVVYDMAEEGAEEIDRV